MGDIIEEVPDEFTYRISFDDSQISEGTKRPITQAFNRARDWAKENPNATQQDLDGFKKGLSDEIESMGLDPEGVTGKAKGALINIKDSYRDRLHQDPEYARVMEQYSKSSKVMDDVERFLEYDFRNSSTTGKAGKRGEGRSTWVIAWVASLTLGIAMQVSARRSCELWRRRQGTPISSIGSWERNSLTSWAGACWTR